MRKLNFIWFWLAMAISGYGQTPLHTLEGKALWKSIQKGKVDTNQVYRYLDYGFLWEAYSLDSAGKWYIKAGDLSKQIGFPLGEIKYRTNYTYVLNLQGKFTESIRLNKESMELAKAHPNLKYEGKCLANIGLSYIMNNQFDSGISFLLDAKNWFEKEGDQRSMATIQIKIANSNLNAGYQKKGYDEAKRALQMVESWNDTSLLVVALEAYTLACFNLGLAKEGLSAAKRQLALTMNKPLTIESVQNLLRISGFYNELDQPLKAIPYAKDVYNYGKKSNNPMMLLRATNRLSRVYLKAKMYPEARVYALEILALSKGEKVTNDVLYAYETLSIIEAAYRNFEKALEYHVQYVNAVDSIHKYQIDSRFLEYETKFESDRKEKQILTLKGEKSRQELLMVIGLLGALVVVGLVLFLYWRVRVGRRIAENRVVQLQKERQVIATIALLKGQDEERSRLARDLHDGLGGMLSGLKFSLSNMKGNMILDQENASAFQSSIGMLDNVISEMRRVAHSMMPEALVRFGLKEATQDLCDQVGKSSGVQVHFQAIGSDWNLEKSISVALFRIAQELLNNILKHAEASQIQVQLVKDENHISLTVEDNGKGFDPSEATQGAGLTSIRTRTEALGGSFDIQSKPGEGSSFLVEVIS